MSSTTRVLFFFVISLTLAELMTVAVVSAKSPLSFPRSRPNLRTQTANNKSRTAFPSYESSNDHHTSSSSFADGDVMSHFDHDIDMDDEEEESRPTRPPRRRLSTTSPPSTTSVSQTEHRTDVTGSQAENEFQGLGICQPYRGQICSQYIGNMSIFVPAGRSQDVMEVKMTQAFSVVATSQDISPLCHRFAIPSLCFVAFPLCDEMSIEARPRKVCRDECEMLEESICRMEYAIAKKHPLIESILPACQDLPSAGSKDSVNCLRMGVPNVVQVVHEHTCYTGNGNEYRGTASRTKTGMECNPWNRQVYYRTADYPEIIGGHNFCRNPGGMESTPWCFVSDNETVKKQECDVPKCIDHFWMYVVAPGVGAFALFFLVISICCLRRSRSSKGSVAGSISSRGRGGSPSSLNVRANRKSGVEMNSLLSRKNIRATQYGLNSIRFLEELGEGAFGKVYRGELVMPQGAVQVAIKTLKEDATTKTRNDFQREADLMTDLRHPNIVCLLGVCFSDEPHCLLFEFMSHGDLHQYLVNHSPNGDAPLMGKKVLDIQDFLHIATQIAAGMEYLSAHHFVHRDLAARNILVGEHLTVKISDFGLSRDIYASDYYRVQSKSLLPVRWMSPEAILFGKFTTESDVWSFGVVLWEVFSFGHQPYFGYSNQEVIEMIRRRHLLRCPEDCPPHIYSLMMETWHELPHKRPSFTDLHTRLSNWKAVYSNPTSNSVVTSGSDCHSSKSSGNLSSQRLMPGGATPKAGLPLPPPPRAPSYPVTQPNTPVTSSNHYSSHTIKGTSSNGLLHSNIPAGGNPQNMNHNHIQQHFSNHMLPTPPPQANAQSFLLYHNHLNSRPSTPGQGNLSTMPRPIHQQGHYYR